ncbi:MAG TPA: hypothetical protein VMU50_12930, partial [Polyangia bacterium]|nr:hypothetical protein [Polyangia bacterium]
MRFSAFELAAAAVALGLAGCATFGGAGGRERWSADATAGWRALVDGRGDQAAVAFGGGAAEPADDPIAAFGRGTLAYDRGDRPRALGEFL